MTLKEQLTTETLTKREANSFRLVNNAIGMAQALIRGGKIPRVSPDIHNQAFQILLAIDEGRDLMTAVDLDAPEEEEEVAGVDV